MRWSGSIVQSTISSSECDSQARQQCTSPDFVFIPGKVTYHGNDRVEFILNNAGSIPINNKIIIQRTLKDGSKATYEKIGFNNNPLLPGSTVKITAPEYSDPVFTPTAAVTDGNCGNLQSIVAIPVITYTLSGSLKSCEARCTEQQIAVPASGISCVLAPYP